MSLLCYVTNQIEQDATSHGIAKADVHAFAAKVERRQSLAGFDHFPPPCLVKKKLFGFNFRLVAAERRIGDHLVVVFLRLLIRGGNDYADLQRDPSIWAERAFTAAIDNESLTQWVDRRTQAEPPPPAPMLSPTEQTFLWSNAHSDHQDDVIICETAEWVAGVREPRVSDRLVRLPELILEAIRSAPGIVHTIRSPADDRLAILSFNAESTNQCVLISVGYSQPEEELRSRSETWLRRLAAADTESILRHARRSYPSIICCDDDMWIAVQKDPQANLALSPEEAEILRTSHLHNPSLPGFPLFINGRAGSGKSTLLQYLFAEILLRWASQFRWNTETATRPLYLASSRELLKVAHEVVRSLLTANHQHLLASQKIESDFLGYLENCFQDSLQYMWDCAGSDANIRFPWPKYISYATFRRLWLERFGREKKAIHEYGPQISWHVIRGFIKGMSIDDVLARDDYEELPQDERTVSRQVYETVYDRVWTAWYEPLCKSGKAWDSQDLVRHLIDNDHSPTSHVAVFCDEAQDFTRLELEAIYRCSIFSDRQIDVHSVKRVPFVFAGDPFQTLNPTGFRWESVRAAFTERILRSLCRFNSRTELPRLNYQELSFNYRSSQHIVHLCNSIQAVRAKLFGHHSLNPQNTWQLADDSSPPAFFEKGDPNLEAALREQSDVVLIVPCEEGEEVEYAANDEYLRSVVQTDENGTPRNVLSASRAKGLEFLRVALYGWANRDEARVLAARLKSPNTQPLTVDERLGLEYFMNNLYVAASRARRRLFVIDENESRNGLWWFVSDEANLSRVLCGISRHDAWQAQSGIVVQGVPESFKEDRDDPRTIGERFEREGLSKEDSYLLKQASIQYALGGDPKRADVCRALANLFDGRFQEAGDSFKKANRLDRAIDAYWRGSLFREIADCATSQPEFARRPECRLATYIVGASPTVRECRTLVEQLLDNTRNNDEMRHAIKSSLWQAAIEAAVMKCLEGAEKAVTKPVPSDYGDLADFLAQLELLGLAVNAKQCARLLIAAGRDGDALKRLSDDGSDTYRDVKARALIADAKASGRVFSATESKQVADYYFRQRRVEDASRIYEELGDSARLIDCFRQSLQARAAGTNAILRSVLVSLITNAAWEPLISILEKGEPHPGSNQERWSREECAAVLDAVRKERLGLTTVIPALAASDRLSVADSKLQQRVSTYLANQLFGGGVGTWKDALSPAVAGAAIERAGKDIDALKFYESWRDSTDSPRDREYAERRWAVCKLRQASREEREGYEKKAGGYRQDAARIMKKYGWGEDDVPDAFPEVTGVGHETRAEGRSRRGERAQPVTAVDAASPERETGSRICPAPHGTGIHGLGS